MWRHQNSLPRNAPTLAVLVLTLCGAALRLDGSFDYGLHADEALFASWARLIGTWRDPLLRAEMVDKPPLLFYLQALHYPLMGTAAPWVARLPNLVASLFVVPLTARLVWQLFGDSLAMVIAAILVSFSPLLVQLSGTAFTDPLLTTLLLASLVAASGDAGRAGQESTKGARALVSGLLLGAAFATKYQAVLFVPLVVAVAAVGGMRGQDWRRWLVGLVLPVAGVVTWQLARGGGVGLWTQQMNSFGGLRLAWSWELWPRLEAWGALWGALIEAPVLAFGLVLFAPVFLALLIQQQDRATALDQLLLLFLVGYALLHWFVAVPVWDRYLLPAAPLAAVLLGRFASRVVAFAQPAVPVAARGLAMGVVLLFLAVLAPGVVAGEGGAWTRTAASAEEGSAAEIAQALEGAPYGTVLYDHWYSWQWRYYLMDSGVFVSWFAHPAALVEDLHVFMAPGAARYVVLPRDSVALVVQRQLREAGYGLQVVKRGADMTLFLIRR